MNNSIFTITSFFITSLLIIGCSSPTSKESYDYGTQSDSARYYFQKGWEEILDNGRWTESEEAFRKAVEFDPNWALGKSLVGRITRNLQERQQLLAELERIKDKVGEEELRLLEVNMQSMVAANNRGLGIPNPPESGKMRRELAEKSFGAFARKYPEDDYFKAEYIEFLHANHGAQVALDSLRLLALPRQMKLGFYISYAAVLELELDNIDKAQALSKELNATLIDPSYLSPLMTRAQIYQAQDSLGKALELVNQVVEADSNHIIALGMQARLKQMLENR